MYQGSRSYSTVVVFHRDVPGIVVVFHRDVPAVVVVFHRDLPGVVVVFHRDVPGVVIVFRCVTKSYCVVPVSFLVTTSIA